MHIILNAFLKRSMNLQLRKKIADEQKQGSLYGNEECISQNDTLNKQMKAGLAYHLLGIFLDSLALCGH